MRIRKLVYLNIWIFLGGFKNEMPCKRCKYIEKDFYDKP